VFERVGLMLASAGRWVYDHKILSIALIFIVAGLGIWVNVATRYEGGGARAQAIQQALADRWGVSGSNLEEALDAGAEEVSGHPSPPPAPAWGDLVARISTTRLGLTWYVVEGVNQGDIASAPGHYPGTALPGQKGNFAVAGHREHNLFWDLDQMRTGDVITVETRHWRYTYVVTHDPIIGDPKAWDQVSPVPPGFQRGDKVLTLTTCDPKWDNYHRMFVHAKLTSAQKVS